MMSVEKYGLVHYYPIVLLHQTLCEGIYANYAEARKKGELLANMSESIGAVFLKGLAVMESHWNITERENIRTQDPLFVRRPTCFQVSRAYRIITIIF